MTTIELKATPPYPKDKKKYMPFWLCVMQIKDKNGKIDFMNDGLYFETWGGGFRIIASVRGYKTSHYFTEPDSLNFIIEEEEPVMLTIKSDKDIDLTGLYYTLHIWSDFYNEYEQLMKV